MKECVTPDLLIIFTRYPAPGKVKTRLIPALGEEASAGLQLKMTLYTLQEARRAMNRCAGSLEVHFEEGSKDLMKKLFGSDLKYVSQQGKDLGEKMLNSFYRAFKQEKKRVVICGTDCPGITAELMACAFRELEKKEVVIGPAKDGGYYLLGLSRMIPELFKDMPWGTSKVFNKTLYILNNMSLTYTLFEPLSDVDRPEDLFLCQKMRPLRSPNLVV